MNHPKQSGEITKLRSEIERLRSELAETRVQQSTSAEVLKVISGSSFDLNAVLSTLAESAAILCGCNHAAIYLRDGSGLRGAHSSVLVPKKFRDRSISFLKLIGRPYPAG